MEGKKDLADFLINGYKHWADSILNEENKNLKYFLEATFSTLTTQTQENTYKQNDIKSLPEVKTPLPQIIPSENFIEEDFDMWYSENIIHGDKPEVRISNEEIAELEAHLAKINISMPIKLKPGETITDPKKFIESHMKIIIHNQNRRSSILCFDRLKKLISVMLGI